MRKKLLLILAGIVLAIFAACSSDEGNHSKDTDDETKDEVTTDDLPELTVDLEVPEAAEVDEEVTFTSTVKYDGDLVEEADQVQYEVWENGKKDDGEMIDAENNNDGTYSIDYRFNHDANYTVQVHVDAEGIHTMPKAEIIVGEGSDEAAHAEPEFKTEGFDLHFNQPEDVKAGDEEELIVHLTLNNKELEGASVQYEISQADEEKVDWIDTKETTAGEYLANYTFANQTTYTVVIHVEDDDDLHEHADYEINVK